MRRLIWPVLVLAATAVLQLAACQGEGPPGKEPVPRIDDINSWKNWSPATGPAEWAAPMTARVTVLDFPLDADLESAWALSNRIGLSSPQIAAWKRNGLRVGLLEAKHLDAFLAALPAPRGNQSRLIVSGGEPVALAFTGALPASYRVKLSLAPDLDQTETLAGGRLQFLVRVARDGDGGRVDLVPHHYLAKANLVPRPDAEKMLDGRLFAELALRAHLAPDQLLVIGVQSEPVPAPAWVPVMISLTQPASPAANPPPSSPPSMGPPSAGVGAAMPTVPPAGGGPAAAPGPATRPQREDSRIPSDRLGAGLLTGTRLGKPLQMLVFISVAPAQ